MKISPLFICIYQILYLSLYQLKIIKTNKTMKLTLKDRMNGMVLTIITDATYVHDLPCLGEDGMMYNLHKIWGNDKHFHTDRIVLIDEEQKFFLSEYININDEHMAMEDFQKNIFDLSNTTDDYILLNGVFKDALITKSNEIKKLIEDNENFNCAYSLVFNRPEDLVESRTSWEDLEEYMSSLVYLINDIYDIVK